MCTFLCIPSALAKAVRQAFGHECRIIDRDDGSTSILAEPRAARLAVGPFHVLLFSVQVACVLGILLAVPA